MALRLIGRRVPMLRDLSVVSVMDAAPANTYKLLTMQWSSSSSSSSGTTSADGNTTSGSTKSATTTESGSGAVAGSPETTQPATSTSPAPIPTSTTVGEDDEWTEVVHASGQLYYWNQRTGETTELGVPKPESKRRGGAGGHGGAGGGSGSAGGGGSSTEGSTHETRTEAPLEDRTGYYAGMGVVLGVALGWMSQFF